MPPTVGQIVDQACEAIRSACRGFGTDEDALIETLVHFPVQLLPQLESEYKAKYGKSLQDVLKSETSGDFGKLLRYLVVDESVVAAHGLKKAFDGLGFSHKDVGEVLIGRTNRQIDAIKRAYQSEFGEDLEKRIISEAGGDTERFLVALIQGRRDEQHQFRDVRADVEALYNAGEKKWGTDEGEFIKVLANRNIAHLYQVFDAYAKQYGKTMHKVIEKEMSGKLRDLMTMQVDYVVDRNTYFAELLESSMAGIGTNEKKLSRLVVRLRRDVAMVMVKDAYLKKYGKSLDHRIKGETSGDYCKLLIGLVELPYRQ